MVCVVGYYYKTGAILFDKTYFLSEISLNISRKGELSYGGFMRRKIIFDEIFSFNLLDLF
jgi:hypothetical protein